MSQFSLLKDAIKSTIKTNGNNEITGQLLQNVLLSIINSIGANYQFIGIAQENTNPGTPDQNVFYLAGPGTYVNFGNKTVANGQIGVLKYNGEWSLELLGVTALIGSIYLNDRTDVTLPYFINEINVSLAFPTDGTDGTDRYTLQNAINTVFNRTQVTLKILAKRGSKITFIDDDGVLETWIYYKDGLSITKDNWIRVNMTTILSKSEYEALEIKDANMLYFIYE